MGYFEQVLEQAAAVGEVDKPLQPAREWLAKADQLNEALKTARAAEEAEYARLVEAAASSGKLPELNGHGRWIFDSPASKATIAAVAQCHLRASAAARSAGPALFEALQRRIKTVVDESVRLTKSLPDTVVSERTAMQAGDGGQHFTTWIRLGELLAEWERCHKLNRTMGFAGWVDAPGHASDRLGAHTYMAYGKPTQLGTIPRGTPRERHLAAAVAAGCEPGLYGWTSAVQRLERLDRRQRRYGHMEVIELHDSLGNVIAEQRGPETPAEFVRLGG